MNGDFDFETDRVVQAIRDRQCRMVLLQFPEGLKRRSAEVARTIAARVSATVVISGEPCFGACDIPATDADMIVHYGHLPIPCLESPKTVMYVQARSRADPYPVLEAALPQLRGKVGLLTTAQHLHLYDGMAEFLRSRGVEVLSDKGDGRVYGQGHVLGCNASCARAVAAAADMFLLVCTGNFHPLAVALSTPGPVLVADPVSGELRDMAPMKERMLRQRHSVIERARQARRVGIIVSTKHGQRRGAVAMEMLALLESAGLEPVLVEMELVTPGALANIGLDAWVSTACPRLAMDDYATFPVPVLTPPEAEILLGKRAWEDYIFDEIA